MARMWKFDSTAAAYDACQCDDRIADGDILVIPSEHVVGVAHTWPFAVTQRHGALHVVRVGAQLDVDAQPAVAAAKRRRAPLAPAFAD